MYNEHRVARHDPPQAKSSSKKMCDSWFLRRANYCPWQKTAAHHSIDRHGNQRITRNLYSPGFQILQPPYLFGLKKREPINVLPTLLTNKWNISAGYMTFLTLDMLNDLRPKSRNQIVLNALRSRLIAGNKTNRSSMGSTVSRLKSAGIAEDHDRKGLLLSRY